MASILQFLLKKFRYIKHWCFQFGQSCVWGKHPEIQISRSMNIGSAFLVSETQEKQKIVESILEAVSTLRAEILWTLKVASSHFSFGSCLGLNRFFRCMFTDVKLSSLSNWARQNVVTLWILNLPLTSKTCWNQIKASACISWEYEQIIERVANGCAD